MVLPEEPPIWLNESGWNWKMSHKTPSINKNLPVNERVI
jgi:hypothetical protein